MADTKPNPLIETKSAVMCQGCPACRVNEMWAALKIKHAAVGWAYDETTKQASTRIGAAELGSKALDKAFAKKAKKNKEIFESLTELVNMMIAGIEEGRDGCVMEHDNTHHIVRRDSCGCPHYSYFFANEA